MAREAGVTEGISISRPREKVGLPKRFVGKKTRIAFASLAILGIVEAAGAIVNEQTNQQPVSAHTIIQDATWPWNLARSMIEEIQDNKKTVVAPENSFPYTLDTSSFTPITREQAVQKIKNNIADIENHTIKMYLPFDKETLEASPNLKYDQVQKAVIPPYLDEALRKQLGTIKNSIQIDGLPDGKIIKWSLPSQGKLRVSSIAGQEKRNGYDTFIPSYSTARIDFQDENGRQLAIIISVLGGEPQFDLSKASWEGEGVDIGFYQPIFKISKDNVVGGQAVPGDKGQVVINAFYMQENPPTSIPNFTVPKLPIPLKIDFLNEVIVE